MTGADIIREVSLDLNDAEPGYENTRWSVELLQSYLREALTLVSRSMKSWFAERRVVELQPGGVWQEACACDEIIRILGESTSSGRLLRYLRRLEDSEEYTWAGDVDVCPASDKSYRMLSYSLSSVKESEFRVYPPVPVGAKRYVLVECYTAPTGDQSADVPSEAVPAVKQWMLFRALAIDSENNAAIMQLAGAHKTVFYEMMTLFEKEKAEEANGSLRAVQNQAPQRVSR